MAFIYHLSEEGLREHKTILPPSTTIIILLSKGDDLQLKTSSVALTRVVALLCVSFMTLPIKINTKFGSASTTCNPAKYGTYEP